MPRFSLGDLLKCVGFLSVGFGCIGIAAQNAYSPLVLLGFLAPIFLGAGAGILYHKTGTGVAWGCLASGILFVVGLMLGSFFAVRT